MQGLPGFPTVHLDLILSESIQAIVVSMQILLIHGLARTSLSLSGLDGYLRQAGYTTHQFSYFALFSSFDQIVLRLRQRIRNLAAQGPYAVVAHSLGGILTRAALADTTLSPPCHVVMMGPPNQPPRLAPYAWKFWPFQWFTGQCGFNLTCTQFYAALPPLTAPYTILAGNGGPQGPLSPFGSEPNDGIVAVSETRLTAQDRLIELPVWHTFMMNDARIRSAVVQALNADSVSEVAFLAAANHHST